MVRIHTVIPGEGRGRKRFGLEDSFGSVQDGQARTELQGQART